MRRNALRIIFIAVFFNFFLLFFSCDRNRSTVRDDEREYTKSRTSSSRTGGNVLREVNSSSSRFRVLKKSDFDEEDCEDDKDCRSLCRDMFSSSARDKCEDDPIDMVEFLHDTFLSLRNIRNPDNPQIDPSAVALLFDREPQMFNRELDDEWGVRGISAFLSWVASNPSASNAMRHGTNEQVLIEVLLELTELRDEDENIARAMSIGLARRRDTFLYFIQENNNEAGLELALELLQENDCGAGSKDCKLLALCGREEITQEYSQYDRESSCYYLNVDEAEDADWCYTQGPDVWSYVQRELRSGDVRDSDLDGETLGSKLCDKFCKGQGERCNL